MQCEYVLVLCVTRMENGVCLAGISQTTPRWVRPVRRTGPVLATDLVDRRGHIIKPFDIVTFDLLELRSRPPHREDWVTDFDQHKPTIKSTIPDAQRTAILQPYVEDALDCLLEARTRSLCMIAPDTITAVYFNPANRFGRYEARVEFEHKGRAYGGEGQSPGYPCTDLRLRAWGRTLLAGHDRPMVLSSEHLRQCLGSEQIFLVIGLGREFQGRHWPLVVGFLAIPDYQAQIDLSNL